MKTIIYLDHKKITKKEAERLLGKEIVNGYIKKAKAGFFEDPYEQQSWMTGCGIIVIEFC